MNVRVGDPFADHVAVSVAPLITPVVLSSRSLWSMVRPGFSVDGDNSPFHATLASLQIAGFKAPVVLADQRNRRLVSKLLREAGVPVAALQLTEGSRHTSGTLKTVAAELAETDADALVLIVPDDSPTATHTGLEQAIALALPHAREGRIVSFARTSQRPANGKIWLEAADNLQILAQVRAVDATSDLATAKAHHADHAWFWNSGIYLVSARTLAQLDDLNGKVDSMILSQTDRLVMVKIDAGWPEVTESAATDVETTPEIETLASGKDFEVRRMTLEPGGKIALAARDGLNAHWTVISGSAYVISRSGERTIQGGGSQTLVLGDVHRISNRGTTPLVLIEVQAGTAVGKAPLRQAAA